MKPTTLIAVPVRRRLVLTAQKRREIAGLMRLFKDIDRKAARFARATDLRCPQGCGQCCESACVAASVLEMQPAAAELYRQGELDRWAARIDPLDEQARCVFYSPSVLANGGHCRIYDQRPFVCRLFGFSMRADKRQNAQLMICRVVKERWPEETAAAQKRVLRGLKAPRPMDYFMKSYSVAPMRANETMNINTAFLKAAELIHLCFSYSTNRVRKEVNANGQ